MNEQIRELVKQAGFEEHDGHISIQGVYMFNTYRMEKFAELIVKECANIVNNLEQYEGQGDCSTAEYIKEHFGVE